MEGKEVGINNMNVSMEVSMERPGQLSETGNKENRLKPMMLSMCIVLLVLCMVFTKYSKTFRSYQKF